MRAAVVQQFGPVEDIRAEEFPDPWVRARRGHRPCDCSRCELCGRRDGTGAARRREPPFVPGVEAAGTIERVGSQTDSFREGQRVVYWHPLPGAFAELASVPTWRVVAIPDDVTDEVAVALMVQGATAHYLATDSFELRPGTSCLVYAAADGVGHLLVQIARLRGARVLAVVGNEGKVAFARDLGADVVINRSDRDVLEAVRAETGGEGVDAVYDAVGAATIEQSLLATRRRGTCVLYNAASGPVGMLDTSLMQRAGSVFFTRPGLGDHLRDAAEYGQRMADLFEWRRRHQLTPRLGGEWDLDGVPEALARIGSGETTGKLLIRARSRPCPTLTGNR